VLSTHAHTVRVLRKNNIISIYEIPSGDTTTTYDPNNVVTLSSVCKNALTVVQVITRQNQYFAQMTKIHKGASIHVHRLTRIEIESYYFVSAKNE
jgi:hypothetical protein